MSKADSINKKIRKAYGKVGNTLGYPFEIYRPWNLENQISTQSFIDVKNAAFAIDNKFMRSIAADKLPVYTAYVDGLLEELFDLQQGDILYREETGETYITTQVETHKAIQAFACNNRLTVYTTAYSDPGTGFAGGDSQVATSLPCYIDIRGPSGGDLGYIPGASYGSDAYDRATIYCWDPEGTLSRSHMFDDRQGRRWNVISAVDVTPIGTVIQVEEQK